MEKLIFYASSFLFGSGCGLILSAVVAHYCGIGEPTFDLLLGALFIHYSKWLKEP